MKRDLVPSQTSDPEVFQGDVINPYEYDYDYNREQRGKILDTINSAVAIEKTNAAIAKKEVDTSAYATKTHVDSERAYIDYYNDLWVRCLTASKALFHLIA